MYHPHASVLSDPPVEEPNVVAMLPDPTPVLVGVLRQVHLGKVRQMTLKRVSQDLASSTVRLQYRLRVELNTSISLGTGSTGGDCQQFSDSVAAFDRSWKVETGRKITALTLGFELIAEEEDGKYESLKWDRDKDRVECEFGENI